jgi:hypothetical protein
MERDPKNPYHIPTNIIDLYTETSPDNLSPRRAEDAEDVNRWRGTMGVSAVASGLIATGTTVGVVVAEKVDAPEVTEGILFGGGVVFILSAATAAYGYRRLRQAFTRVRADRYKAMEKELHRWYKPELPDDPENPHETE